MARVNKSFWIDREYAGNSRRNVRVKNWNVGCCGRLIGGVVKKTRKLWLVIRED